MDTSVVLRPLAAYLLMAPGLWSTATSAAVPPIAYQYAAQAAEIPPEVLYAIALQESGLELRGRRRPWPWTLNVAGKSQYYSSRTQACAALQYAARRVKATRIDVGLAQLNLGYQRAHYSAPCELLSPAHNLTIAASILRRHRRAGEDWLPAIGRYHRPAGGPLATRYQRRVSEYLSRLQKGTLQ
ncbi:transglycosylase SLT domain-containing protein [Pseudomonas huaxiensis]|uniref:transglycosylase SLT domain-containing protein n=1 Tax=Pseudomonas huaxiensis TaxID=2213017 RepID=UPI000DA64EF2|nr:transglycosylase SLT domain-containing protein [Pseudomonas huaxiensis]